MPDLTPLEAAETLELHAPWVGGTYRDAMLLAASYLRKIAAGEYKPVVHAHWNGWTTSAYIGSEYNRNTALPAVL